MKNKFLVMITSFCLASNLFAASPVSPSLVLDLSSDVSDREAGLASRTRGMCISLPATPVNSPRSTNHSLSADIDDLSSSDLDIEPNVQNPGMAASGSASSHLVAYNPQTHQLVPKQYWHETNNNLRTSAAWLGLNSCHTPRSSSYAIMQALDTRHHSPSSGKSDPDSFAGRDALLETDSLFRVGSDCSRSAYSCNVVSSDFTNDTTTNYASPSTHASISGSSSDTSTNSPRALRTSNISAQKPRGRLSIVIGYVAGFATGLAFRFK